MFCNHISLFFIWHSEIKVVCACAHICSEGKEVRWAWSSKDFTCFWLIVYVFCHNPCCSMQLLSMYTYLTPTSPCIQEVNAPWSTLIITCKDFWSSKPFSFLFSSLLQLCFIVSSVGLTFWQGLLLLFTCSRMYFKDYQDKCVENYNFIIVVLYGVEDQLTIKHTLIWYWLCTCFHLQVFVSFHKLFYDS